MKVKLDSSVPSGFFGHYIRRRAAESGLSYGEIANRSGVSANSIKITASTGYPMSLDKMLRLGAVFGESEEQMRQFFSDCWAYKRWQCAECKKDFDAYLEGKEVPGIGQRSSQALELNAFREEQRATIGRTSNRIAINVYLYPEDEEKLQPMLCPELPSYSSLIRAIVRKHLGNSVSRLDRKRKR